MKISKTLYQAVTDRKIRFSYLTKLGIFNGLSDEQYLKLKYKNVFGRDLDLVHCSNARRRIFNSFAWSVG